MLSLFDSEDPRERDYLKTIMHRIYGRFMILRPYIRTQVMNQLLRITYESEEHNGLSELLEILSSVISGYTVPLKQEHTEFFGRVLVPLHKVKGLSGFHTALMTCIKNFLEKDPSLGTTLICGLLKLWPITNPAKEILFYNEIEEIFELHFEIIKKDFFVFGEDFLRRVCLGIRSLHF